MKNRTVSSFLVLLLLISFCLSLPAFAEGGDSEQAEEVKEAADVPPIDWSQYSYDQLVALHKSLGEYIHKLDVQYAIENGNRIITLNENEVNIYTGRQFTLVPEVRRVVEDAPENTAFIWSSSDETVATVSDKGDVTALSYGDAVITCTAEDDEYIFATAAVHATLPVSNLTLSETNCQLLLSEKDAELGQTSLSCTVEPENAFVKDVSWSSSDETIATVDENGFVQALQPGQVKITATSMDTYAAPKTAVCNITVLRAVASIGLEKTDSTLNIGASDILKATVHPEDATQKTLRWESSDPEVASVAANGTVTARALGKATISCYATDGSETCAQCEVTVIQMATGISIEPSTLQTLNKGKSITLHEAVAPENVTNPAVTWESSDPSVAVVNSTGTVTAVSCGSADIVCKTADGSEKSARVSVYVPSIAVEKMEYDVTSKDGVDIVLKYYGQVENFSFSPESCIYYQADMTRTGEEITIHIDPIRAGKAILTLADKADNKSTMRITLNIDHSACYDSQSYPVGNYTNIMRSPSSFDGSNMSITGYVLQISEGWFSTTLRIATSGRYNNVFYVTCSSEVAKGIIEDDLVTVYGSCSGTETYKTVLGGSITIPSLEAEKIYLGRH